MYGNYGARGYSEGYSAGGYNESGYGRRGVRGSGRRYRGEDMMEEMKEHFQNYQDGKEEMYKGNYGAEGITDKAFDYMLKSAKDFFMFLAEDSDKPEQMEKIKKTAREISERL